MVGLTGFEPATYASQTQRSSQVELQSDERLAVLAGYDPATFPSTKGYSSTELQNQKMVEPEGLKPPASCVQGRRSVIELWPRN